MNKPQALYTFGAEFKDSVYGPVNEAALRALVEIPDTVYTAEMLAADPSPLRDVEILFGTWYMPTVDAAFLAHAPKLKAIFYAAGSIRKFATDAMWERGIIVSSAYAANAIPVAEYTVAAIVFSLKRVWQHAFAARQTGRHLPKHDIPGCYRTTVGLISLGMVGRAVLERLRSLDVRIVVHDPFLTGDAAQQLGVELLSLDQLFREADVVSLHTPLLKETEGMVTGNHFGLMKPGATFINTARGAVVREDEMIAALRQRPDLFAVIDVTIEEPLPATSPLFTLPNVALTPHIAGSQALECRRMGAYMVEELKRYLAGEPLRWQVTRDLAARLA